jgi:hypothetical protein
MSKSSTHWDPRSYSTNYKDIHVGDKLTVWVSEDRFAVYGTPGAESTASQGLPPHQ